MSDLLQLCIGQFVGADGTPVERFALREQKRGKRYELAVNDSIADALRDYLQSYPLVLEDSNHFIFFNTKTMNYEEPIQRGQAWKLISHLCEDVGLCGDYGTHTLRKTWAYHARMNGVDLTLIMDRLNHNNLAYTKRYLDIPMTNCSMWRGG